MLKIKSFNHNEKLRQTTKDQVAIGRHQGIRTMANDYVQCNVSQHHKQKWGQVANCQKSSTAYNKYKVRKYNAFSNTFYSKQSKSHNQENKNLYQKIPIINISKGQQRMIKHLQAIALKKKVSNQTSMSLKNQIIDFNAQNALDMKNSENFERIPVSLETLFNQYLMYNEEKLKCCKFNGNLKGKIIVPFLSMYRKIKADSQKVVLQYNYEKIQSNRLVKTIKKAEIHKIFKEYKPKIRVLEQVERITINNRLYEQLYNKFESYPINQSYINNQNNSKSCVAQLPKQQDAERVLLYFEKQVNTTPTQAQELQKQKQEEERKKFQKENIGKLEFRQSKIKQRFQDRFKRQLKQLSEDCTNIIKTKNEQEA